MTQKTIQQIIFAFGGIFTLVGAMTQFAHFEYAPYIFAVGVALLIYSHVKNILATSKDNFRTKRLSRIGFISALMLLVACYFMFIGSNAWVVFLLIYAVVTLVLTFRSE